MFKKSRQKIVAAIMSVLTLLWLGTLSVIYVSSYYEVNNTNLEMLEEHVALYTVGKPGIGFGQDGPAQDRGSHTDTKQFKLSTFYTVAFSYNGEILEIKNDGKDIYSDAELEKLARGVLNKTSYSGVTNKLNYYKADKGGYTLIAFMDNTILRESMSTLFRYTLIFGSIALVVLYFLAVYLAKRIVQPLEESYQKQKQFISDAGHELKTPVSVVNANAELLSRQIGENQWLANIQYENERMGKLVGQLLELARTEMVKPQMECLDLSRLVAGGTLPFEGVAFDKGLVLGTQIACGITVMGSSTQLSQLVSILVDNAIQHGQCGKEVSVSLAQHRNAAVLSVSNEGTPIPPEKMEQLFERFYRVDEARNGADKHYGLGLAIAKAIVEVHEGRISVSCMDGIVTFEARLPKA